MYNPHFDIAESQEFDRCLLVDDTVDDVTEIRTIIRERNPRNPDAIPA